MDKRPWPNYRTCPLFRSHRTSFICLLKFCLGVCTSCRSFFRRSVQTGQFKSFQCKSRTGDVCAIDSKTRRSCKKCRFVRFFLSCVLMIYCVLNMVLRPSIVRHMIEIRLIRRPSIDFSVLTLA